MSERRFKIDENGEVVDTTKTFMDIMKNTNAWMSGAKKKPVKENKRSCCSECIHAQVCVDYENGDEIYDPEACSNYIYEKTTITGAVFCKDCIYLLDGARIGMCGYFCKRLCDVGEWIPIYADDFCSRGVHV